MCWKESRLFPRIDVATTALDKVPCKPFSQLTLSFPTCILKYCEFFIQQAQKIVKGSIITRMWSCCQKQNVAFRIICQRADKLIASLPSFTCTDRRVGLIDHNHTWAGTLKVKEAPLTLDEIH